MTSAISGAQLVELVATLVDRDPDCEDRAGLGEILRDLNRLSGWIDARKVRCSRQLQRLAAEGRSESASTALLDESRHSAAEANRTIERERVCSLFNGLEDKLAAGDVSADHLDVLARLTKGLSDQDRSDLQARTEEVIATTAGWVSECERRTKQLIAQIRAENQPDHAVDQLNRQREMSHVKRWTDKTTGLKFTLIGLDPIRDTTLHNVIDAHVARLRTNPTNDDAAFPALHARAVFDAVTGGTTDATETTGSTVTAAEVVLHVDARTYAHGPNPDTLCETIDGVAVSDATLRRLCCEAVIQAVLVNPDGTFDQLCAEQRLASRKQRRALAAMYSRCAHPHCTVPFSKCRIHHVVAFERGGKTVLSNMIPVCEVHHHLIHEGGWALGMDADRTATWTRPDGTVWWAGNSINRRAGWRAPPPTSAVGVARSSPPPVTCRQPALI